MRIGNETRPFDPAREHDDEENDRKIEEIFERVGTPRAYRENRERNVIAHGYQHEGMNDLRKLEKDGKTMQVCGVPGCECLTIAREKGFV